MRRGSGSWWLELGSAWGGDLAVDDDQRPAPKKPTNVKGGAWWNLQMCGISVGGGLGG